MMFLNSKQILSPKRGVEVASNEKGRSFWIALNSGCEDRLTRRQHTTEIHGFP